jgi:hypothetical protein
MHRQSKPGHSIPSNGRNCAPLNLLHPVSLLLTFFPIFSLYSLPHSHLVTYCLFQHQGYPFSSLGSSEISRTDPFRMSGPPRGSGRFSSNHSLTLPLGGSSAPRQHPLGESNSGSGSSPPFSPGSRRTQRGIDLDLQTSPLSRPFEDAPYIPRRESISGHAKPDLPQSVCCRYVDPERD